MNRYLKRTLAAVGIASPLLAGCSNYRDWVDPCWPERYNHTARREVVEAFAPQVQNGHILDQTVWNYMFEAGTDELNAFGRQKLDFFVRQRPAPDPNIYLQTAHDVSYNAAEPERFGEARRDLDLKRVAQVQKYLASQMVGRPMSFDVSIHDPYPVGVHAQYAAGSYRLVVAPSTNGPAGSLQTGSSGAPGAPSAQGQQGQPGGGYGGAAGNSSQGPGSGGESGGSMPR
jgi:hypothetical protein